MVTGIVIHMEQYRAGRRLAAAAADHAMIGRRLAAARDVAGLSGVELAAAAGIGPNTLSNWETGGRRPSIDQVAMVLPILRVTLDWVFFGNDAALDWRHREALEQALARLPPKPERRRRRLAAAG